MPNNPNSISRTAGRISPPQQGRSGSLDSVVKASGSRTQRLDEAGTPSLNVSQAATAKASRVAYPAVFIGSAFDTSQAGTEFAKARMQSTSTEHKSATLADWQAVLHPRHELPPRDMWRKSRVFEFFRAVFEANRHSPAQAEVRRLQAFQDAVFAYLRSSDDLALYNKLMGHTPFAGLLRDENTRELGIARFTTGGDRRSAVIQALADAYRANRLGCPNLHDFSGFLSGREPALDLGEAFASSKIRTRQSPDGTLVWTERMPEALKGVDRPAVLERKGSVPDGTGLVEPAPQRERAANSAVARKASLARPAEDAGVKARWDALDKRLQNACGAFTAAQRQFIDDCRACLNPRKGWFSFFRQSDVEKFCAAAARLDADARLRVPDALKLRWTNEAGQVAFDRAVGPRARELVVETLEALLNGAPAQAPKTGGFLPSVRKFFGRESRAPATVSPDAMRAEVLAAAARARGETVELDHRSPFDAPALPDPPKDEPTPEPVGHADPGAPQAEPEPEPVSAREESQSESPRPEPASFHDVMMNCADGLSSRDPAELAEATFNAGYAAYMQEQPAEASVNPEQTPAIEAAPVRADDTGAPPTPSQLARSAVAKEYADSRRDLANLSEKDPDDTPRQAYLGKVMRSCQSAVSDIETAPMQSASDPDRLHLLKATCLGARDEVRRVTSERRDAFRKAAASLVDRLQDPTLAEGLARQQACELRDLHCRAFGPALSDKWLKHWVVIGFAEKRDIAGVVQQTLLELAEHEKLPDSAATSPSPQGRARLKRGASPR